MAGLEYSLLNTGDPEAVAQYERALFRAFYPMEEPLLARLREADTGARRMRLCIPYRDMDIFAARFDGTIIAGAAINYNCDALLQLERTGFSIDKTKQGICEGLAIFNTRSFAENHPVMFELGAFVYKELRRRNVKTVYGTCVTRLLKGYTLLGFREIASRELTSSTIHLLEKDVEGESNGFIIDAGRSFRK